VDEQRSHIGTVALRYPNQRTERRQGRRIKPLNDVGRRGRNWQIALLERYVGRRLHASFGFFHDANEVSLLNFILIFHLFIRNFL
jgi:hypothetical protein